MSNKEYKRLWYIRNRDRILSKSLERTKKIQKDKSQTKICPACKLEFNTSKNNKKYCGNPECQKYAEHSRHNKFMDDNKEHIKNYYRKYDMINKEKRKLSGRKGHLRRKYGITLDDYNKMVEIQEGKCAICGIKFEELHVDHNHSTNEVRSLLCFHCNAGIGHFKENIDLLYSAIQYLSYHNS